MKDGHYLPDNLLPRGVEMDRKTERSLQAAKILEAIYAEIDLFRRLSGPGTEAVLYLGNKQHYTVRELGGIHYDSQKSTFASYPVVFVRLEDYLRMA